jgi:vacuolar protein sorting-associated protein 26
MSLFGFGGGSTAIDIKLDGVETRKHTTIKDK